ncbi:hypothetical protein [Mycobacteroides salmoniphilum]|uniref:hypothetical protein n=1 Tax=Mycobacteroides salmoniphilum TaxID=404941 RepID=UPI0010DBA263|nr:hypothetical protein [Mycobacteroides salmoniphilum]TDZ77134.1 hypothetical protein DE4586_02920 [Mycobacteroides salmoniphilum]TDZ86837.1 hypothetical protein DE4587_02224 [Mycobacteroides salmoniphilum]
MKKLGPSVEVPTEYRLLARRNVPLGELMGGLRAVDVARFSGVSQSTLSRLWSEPLWLEHVGGTTLARLIAVSQSVDRYVHRCGEHQRLGASVASVRATGIGVRDESILRLLKVSSASAVIVVLAAVAEMISGRYIDASRIFSVGWGEANNRVVEALFLDSSDGLLEDSNRFLASAEHFIQNPPPFSEQAEIVGYGIIKHKLAKIGYGTIAVASSQDRAIAFLGRSQVIGRIMREDDLSLVDWYRTRVAAQCDLSANEIWSHATYARDISISRRKLPKSLALRSTARAIMLDIECQNDTYAYYLLTVALPLLLRADSTFGGQRQRMVQAVLGAAEGRANPAIQTAAKHLYTELAKEH